MKIKVIEPYVECRCKSCFNYGTLKKNIGEYCYGCLRKYVIEYPEYIPKEQHYMFLKAKLEKKFDKKDNT